MWVPILLYHRVTNEIAGGPWQRLSVSTRTFENHIRFLHRHGFQCVSPEDVSDAVEGRRVLPHRSIAITFDDGYRDTYTNAFPILQKYGFSATVFLVSSLIGGTNEWDQQASENRPLPLLSESQIREMARAGITFGSHSRTHPRLGRVSSEALEQEILGSKSDLENLLQTKVSSFSYPHFSADERVHRLVRSAGYSAACAGDGVESENARYYLIRILVYNDNLAVMRMKVFGWYRRLRMNPLFRSVKDRITPQHSPARALFARGE